MDAEVIIVIDRYEGTDSLTGFTEHSPLEVIPCSETVCEDIREGLFLAEMAVVDHYIYESAWSVVYCLSGNSTLENCDQPTLWLGHGDCTTQITALLGPGLSARTRPRNPPDQLSLDFLLLADSIVNQALAPWIAENC